MKTILSIFALTALSVLSAGLVGAVESTSYSEPFFKVADGTPLASLEGWSAYGKSESAPLVLNAAGYEGGGVRFTTAGLHLRSIPDSRIAPINTDSRPEFRVKLRVSAERDTYCHASILVGQKGGIYGFQIQFEGGRVDGRKDNLVQILGDGPRWGSGTWEKLEQAKWEKDVWYEIFIGDIQQDSSGTGAVAKLTISSLANPSVKLVDAHPIRSVGAGVQPFSRIDTILVGQRGTTATQFDLDDLSLVRATGK